MINPLPVEKTKLIKITNLLIFIFTGILIIFQIPFIISISSLSSTQAASWTFLVFLLIFLVMVIIFKNIEKLINYKQWRLFFYLQLAFGGLSLLLGIIAASVAPSSGFFKVMIALVLILVIGVYGLINFQVVWILIKSKKPKRAAAIHKPPQSGSSIDQQANSYNEYPQGQIYQPKRLSQNQLNAFDDYAVYQVANDFERDKIREALKPAVVPDFHPQQVQQSIQEDDTNISMVPKAIKTILGMYGFDGSQEADNKIIEHILTVENKEELGRGQDSQCSICLCELEAREHIYILTVCKHYFHEQCLKEWMENKQPNCPYCRKDVILPWNQ